MQVFRLKKKSSSIKQLHKLAKKSKMLELEKLLGEFLEGPQLTFVMSQVRASQRRLRGRRWTTDDKALALSLFHSSPKNYKLLRKIFFLPSVRTLRQAMSNLEIYPGFSEVILSALKCKASNLPDPDKLVCLALDEMAIKEGLEYDPKQDIVEGLDGGEMANHALVFVARGIKQRWKQPFGFFLSNSTINATRLKDLLFQAIDELKAVGLTVIVVVSDQGPNNISTFKTHLKITAEEPFFFRGQDKIFVMFDPPHLVKNVRNNFKKSGFTIDGKTIEWQDVVDFYHKDASKPLRLAPRLTLRHIKLPPFSQLRVKLATQLLSHSVASGMKVMIQWNILDEDAGPTADFIEDMDQLFNCFNSSSLTSTAMMRHALSNKSGHLEFLEAKKTWIQSIQTKSSRKLPCLNGWLIAINALLQLWDFLHKVHHFTFLFTRRLNQDCVENLFSVVRAKGAARDNPNASQFRAALRQIMVDSVMEQSKFGNCEEDLDDFVFTLKQAPESAKATVPRPSTGFQDTLPSSVSSLVVAPPDPVIESPVLAQQKVDAEHSKASTSAKSEELSLQESNVVAYIGGYIVRKIRDKICDPCRGNISASINQEDPKHAFISTKNYAGAKEGLLAPSTSLTTTLEKMETKYREVIDQLICAPHVKSSLSQALVDLIPEDLTCTSCNIHLLILHLMINIRLHHTIRQSNRMLSDKKERKNRKTLKFSHF